MLINMKGSLVAFSLLGVSILVSALEQTTTSITTKPVLSCQFPCLNLTTAYEASENVVWIRIENVTFNSGDAHFEVTTACQRIFNGFLADKLIVTKDELSLLGPAGFLMPKQDYIVFVRSYNTSSAYRLVSAPLPADTRYWRDLINCGIPEFRRNRDPIVDMDKLEKRGFDLLEYARLCGNSAREAVSKQCPNVVDIVCPADSQSWEVRANAKVNGELSSTRTVLWGWFENVMENKTASSDAESKLKALGYKIPPTIIANFHSDCMLDGDQPIITTHTILSVKTSSLKCYRLPDTPSSLIDPGESFAVFLERDAVQQSWFIRASPIPAGEDTLNHISRCCAISPVQHIFGAKELIVRCDKALPQPLMMRSRSNKTCDCALIANLPHSEQQSHLTTLSPVGFYLTRQSLAAIICGVVIISVAGLAVSSIFAFRKIRSNLRPWSIRRFEQSSGDHGARNNDDAIAADLQFQSPERRGNGGGYHRLAEETHRVPRLSVSTDA